MGLLQKLLGKGRPEPDPTADWPEPAGELPLVLPFQSRFGDLEFGAALNAARKLGRPSRFRWTGDEYCELVYAEAGFQIDFDAEKFAYLALLIDEHDTSPDIGSFTFAEPKVMLPDGQIIQLSKSTTRAEIEEQFGAPEDIDDAPDGIVLKYDTGAVEMEFEFPPEGTLERWSLFPS